MREDMLLNGSRRQEEKEMLKNEKDSLERG